MADIITNTLQIGSNNLILRDADAQEQLVTVKDGLADLKEDFTRMGNEETTPIDITWEHGGIDNATGQTNKDGSTIRSRCITYYKVSDLLSVVNASSNACWIIFYTYDSTTETYVYNASASVISGTYTFNQITGGSQYVRFDYRGSLANAESSVDILAYYKLVSDVKRYVEMVEPVTYCRNIVGEKTTVLYPCDLGINEYITFSTSDGQPFGVRCSLVWYDENKTRVDQWGSDPTRNSRTVQNTTGAVIKFMRWERVLDNNRHIQTEYGQIVSEYQEYFPATKNVIPFIEGSNVFISLPTAENSWNSALHTGLKDYATPCAKFSALMAGDSVNSVDAIDKCEAFMFFTDPHTQYASGMNHFEEYMGQIQKVYRSTPATFALCGGDWLGNGDTPSEAAYKLGLVGATCKSMFDKCYMLVGNHDVNNQGKKDSQSANWTTRLPIESLKNLWYDGQDAYYSFEGRNTKFYCFDTQTGTDSLSALDNYGNVQAKWFADSLLIETSPHIAIALHMIYTDNAETTWCALSHLALQIACAYNTRGTITVDGTVYDFSSAVGMVEFVMAGHTHFDSSHTYTEDGASIPVIITTDCGNGQTFPTDATFDLVFVDYDNRQIKCIRVGSGSDRAFAMASNA